MKVSRSDENPKMDSLSSQTLIERIAYKKHKIQDKEIKLGRGAGRAKADPIKLGKKDGYTKTTLVSSECLKENFIVSSLSKHPGSDIFNMLRTKVISRMRANNWKVLAITSPKEDSGKSFTAINLAVSIAMEENHSALLADFDFRRPSLQNYFGIKEAKGLSDYFYNDLPLSEIFIRPDVKDQDLLPKNLTLLPAGNNVSRSAELLSSDKMINLVRELKNRYADRIIIVDLPPLLDTADAMTFLNSADACLLVVAEGESTVDQIKQSMRLIDEKKLIGSVFNKSTGSSESTYY